MILFSIFLGILQGLTEFLPISSSGHLALVENIAVFREYKEILQSHVSLLTFNIVLHTGSLIAIIFYYRKPLLQLWDGFFTALKTKNFKGESIHYIWLLFWATVPVLSVPFYKHIVEQVTENLHVISTLFVVNGILILVAQVIQRFLKKRQEEKTMQQGRWYNALLPGLFQLAAVFPGISRSGSTISGTIIQNIKGEDAVQFSFLMSIPVLLAAILLEGKDISANIGNGAEIGIWIFLGFIFSFLSGWFSLKLLTWIGKKMLFFPFAVYTILLGIVMKILI